MSTTAKRGLWIALLLICLGVGAFALRGMFAFGDPPISQATPSPLAATSSAASATPTAATPSTSASTTGAVASSAEAESSSTVASSAPAPTTSSGSEAQGSAAASESGAAAPASETGAAAPSASQADVEVAAVMKGAPAPWDEISATPAHVDVYADGTQVIGAPIDLVQMRDDGEINPDSGLVGWYGPPQWDTTPGERSQYPAVLAGHVRDEGGKDVFWNLQGIAAGALVVVTYDDGTQAAFRTDADAVSMGKDALTHDDAFAWAWKLPEPGAKVTLITCDVGDGSSPVGTSTNNWAVQATRIA